jgi:hypothetical protein
MSVPRSAGAVLTEILAGDDRRGARRRRGPSWRVAQWSRGLVARRRRDPVTRRAVERAVELSVLEDSHYSARAETTRSR